MQLETFGAAVVEMEPTKECTEYKEELKRTNKKGPLNGGWPPCERVMICGNSTEEGGVMLHFAVSVYLQNFINETIPEDFKEFIWGDEMVRQNASVVVMNRGAHFTGHKWFIGQINGTLQKLRDVLPNTLVFFRATAAGHPNCSLYTKPLVTPLTPESWPFNWGNFPIQNEMARGLIEAVGGVFVDVQPLTSLRPDWHVYGQGKDCLHHCLPGPVDDWVKFVARMLDELV